MCAETRSNHVRSPLIGGRRAGRGETPSRAGGSAEERTGAGWLPRFHLPVGGPEGQGCLIGKAQRHKPRTKTEIRATATSAAPKTAAPAASPSASHDPPARGSEIPDLAAFERG
ncbi:hypothetical protein Pa4123_40300 [Phytohabitans aurantiacus]|uniref:Uncharacterized protein n=1 Tax=Phytohabitans aurantiacus TaxID=3016789 RepID=A0ABQ5QW26_9ACTN|nr:hypothetical protein Pa4123_40300 [Phytohabitans aurantiacus]